MSKITLSTNSTTTNTTTINLEGVRHINDKNRSIIKSIAASQPLAPKVTHTLGTVQPRIITLPASSPATCVIEMNGIQKIFVCPIFDGYRSAVRARSSG